MNNYEEMKIESDVFTTARENFDLLMQRLFASMEKNNSDEGSITLKVDLQMKQDWVPNGEGGSVEVNKPVIKHKVTIAVPVKRLETLENRDGEMWRKVTGYVVTAIIGIVLGWVATQVGM